MVPTDYSLASGLLALAVCLFVFLVVNARSRRLRLPLPPGPPREFLLGNLRSLPTSLMWLTYETWARTYGATHLFLQAVLTYRMRRRRHVPPSFEPRDTGPELFRRCEGASRTAK